MTGFSTNSFPRKMNNSFEYAGPVFPEFYSELFREHSPFLLHERRVRNTYFRTTRMRQLVWENPHNLCMYSHSPYTIAKQIFVF